MICFYPFSLVKCSWEKQGLEQTNGQRVEADMETNKSESKREAR